MTGLKREFELKLLLTTDDLDRLWASPQLAHIGGEPSKKNLRSVYYDTPDLRMHGEGITLRVRDNGNGYVQTIKADTKLKGGISNPIEIEDRLDSIEPDLDRIGDKHFRRKLIKNLEGSSLEPLFETVVTRTAYRLHEQESLIELALDQGEVLAGDRRSEICEAELELISGNPKDLLELAQMLFANSNVRLSSSSKAEQGYRLTLNTDRTDKIEPIRAPKPDVRRGQTCGQAFAEIIRSARQQIVTNRIVVLETDEVEGAHQLRVGLTRLRSALRALKPLVLPQLLCQLDQDAKMISRAVGHLRDADVLIEQIYAPVAGAPPRKSGMDELFEALHEHRIQMRDGARQALLSEQWSRLLLSLALWPPMLESDQSLTQPVEDDAHKALQKRWKNVEKYGHSLESLHPDEKHKMRRSLKKLRYMVEFLAPLYGRNEVKKFTKQLKKLQDIFGYMNDVRMADQLRTICAERCADQPNCCVAAGYVLGCHEERVPRVWSGAIKRWRRLETTDQFWL